MAAKDATAQIQEAARLIKAGQRDRAYQLLKGAIQQNPADWRAWWGLAHASSSSKERYIALQKTLELNPTHDKARGLLNRLEAKLNPQQPAESSPAQSAAAAAAASASPFITPEEPAPWDAPPAEPPPAAASEPLPWDAPGAAAEPAPWDAPYDTGDSGGYGAAAEPAPWDAPYDSGSGDVYDPYAASYEAASPDNPFDAPTGGDTPFGSPFDAPAANDNPFAAVKPVSPSSGGEAWSGPMPTDTVGKPVKKDSGGGAVINVLIAIVATLLVGLVIFFVLSQVDLGGALSGLFGGGFSGASGVSNCDDDIYTTSYTGSLSINGLPGYESLYDAFEAHDWTFQGTAGQQVSIYVQGQEITDPRFKLYGPDGRCIAHDDDSGSGYDAQVTGTLPSTGTYRIRIDVFSGGPYSVSVIEQQQ